MTSDPPFPNQPDDDILDVVACAPPDAIRAPETGITEAAPISAIGSDVPLFTLPAPLSPPRPHPGFWFGSLATLLMFVLCQITIPLGVMVLYLVGQAILSPAGRITLETLGTPEGQKQFTNETAMLLLVSAHLPMILFGLLALRVVAGRNWRREVAVRLPSFTHVILIVLGFPALPILAGGAYLLAKQ
jgi:hypothetical protein